MPWPLRARSGAAEHWPCMNVCEDWEVRWNFHWQDMIRSPHQRRLQPEACTYLHFPKHLETLVISGAPHPTNLQPLSQRHCISNTLKAQQGSWSTIVPPSAAGLKASKPCKVFHSVSQCFTCHPSTCGGWLVLFADFVAVLLRLMTFASGLELAMGLWLGGKTKALYRNTSSICIIRHVWTCLHTVLHCLIFFLGDFLGIFILVHWHAFKHWSHRWLICPRSIVVLVKLMLESSLFFEDCWPCPLNCFREWFWVSLKISMPWVTCYVGLMLFDTCSIMFLSIFGWGVAHLPMDNVFLVQLCFRAAFPQHFSSFTMRTGTCVWSRTFTTHKKTIESVCCSMFFRIIHSHDYLLYISQCSR